jgi:hypothetical protein
MSTVPPDELAARQAQAREYHASRRIIQIDESVRGLRIAINALIREEKALLAERAALQPDRGAK